MRALICFLMFLPSLAFAAGSVSVTRVHKSFGKVEDKRVEIVTISWTGDASDGSVPATSVELRGFVLKVITNPGSTAPTASYDVAFGDPADTALDALAGALADRHTSTTEQVAPIISSSPTPVYLNGEYSVAVTNNSVNSATGDIIVYLVDSL